MAHDDSTRAHRGRCARPTGDVAARRGAQAAPACSADQRRIAHTAFAACLFQTVSELIPAPTLGLAADDAAWQAFDDLLDQAAHFVVDALGAEGAVTVRALAPRLSEEGPVHGALVARALSRLDLDEHR